MADKQKVLLFLGYETQPPEWLSLRTLPYWTLGLRLRLRLGLSSLSSKYPLDGNYAGGNCPRW